MTLPELIPAETMNVPGNIHDTACPDCGHYRIRFHAGGLGCWFPGCDCEPERRCAFCGLPIDDDEGEHWDGLDFCSYGCAEDYAAGGVDAGPRN